MKGRAHSLYGMNQQSGRQDSLHLWAISLLCRVTFQKAPLAAAQCFPHHLFFSPTDRTTKYSYARASNILSKTLIIHGDSDDIIHISHAYRLYQRIPNPIQPLFIHGAGHNDCEMFEEYLIRLEYLVYVELSDTSCPLTLTGRAEGETHLGDRSTPPPFISSSIGSIRSSSCHSVNAAVSVAPYVLNHVTSSGPVVIRVSSSNSGTGGVNSETASASNSTGVNLLPKRSSHGSYRRRPHLLRRSKHSNVVTPNWVLIKDRYVSPFYRCYCLILCVCARALFLVSDICDRVWSFHPSEIKVSVHAFDLWVLCTINSATSINGRNHRMMFIAFCSNSSISPVFCLMLIFAHRLLNRRCFCVLYNPLNFCRCCCGMDSDLRFCCIVQCHVMGWWLLLSTQSFLVWFKWDLLHTMN